MVRPFLVLALASLAGCRSEMPPQDPEPSPARVLNPDTASPKTLCAEAGRTYEVLDPRSETVVARSRGRCVGKEARGYHFVSQLTLAGENEPLNEFHLWLGRDGDPRHAQLRERTQVTHFRWVDEGLVISLHGDSRILERKGPPVWVIPRHAVFVRELMFRRGVGADRDAAVHLTYVPGRDAVVPVVLGLAASGDRVRAVADQGTFVLDPGPAHAFASARLERALTAEGKLVYRAVDGPTVWEPALPETPALEYQLPDDLMAIPVTIEGDDGQPELAGELVARKDARDSGNCGVTFLSGSGPQDRHGFVPGTAIDVGTHELLDAVAQAGCIVLRFDDRGVGKSERGPDNPGYLDLVDDGRRAISFLATRDEVDARKIVVIGHSEGALTATLLANERFGERRKRKLAGVVLMGLVGRNLSDVIVSQLRHVMRDKPPEEVEAEVKKARDIHARVKAGNPPDNLRPIANWMKEILEVDPLEAFTKIRVPVLLLQGGKDFQVDPTLDYAPLAEKLEESTKIRGNAHLFEDLDHIFKPEPGESSVGHYGDLSRRVSPVFIETVVDFIRDQTGLPPADPLPDG